MTPQERSQWIKQRAHDLGFFFCGIAKAEFLEDEAIKLETWLSQNKQGEMQWMANHFDLRTNPALLVPGAKSVISLAYNYYPSQKLESENNFKLSKYAYGRDYHKVIRKKLKHFFAEIKAKFGEVEGRVFVDSAPVMEKVWAAKAGIGWQGKNTLLINKKAGSFFFLSEIILDLELEADAPVKDYCGTCTRCIDACPTHALEAYAIDASKCISYYTIELKNALPESEKNKMHDWMFGCDICQDVCPWNRLSKAHAEPQFMPSNTLLNMRKKDWQELSHELFDELFEGSAVKRTGYEGLTRNIAFLDSKKSS
jgi:epoxyqueuosine reductase